MYRNACIRLNVDDNQQKGRMFGPGGKAFEALMKDPNATLNESIFGKEIGPTAICNRGLAHHELGQVLPARRDYEKAIALDPTLKAAFLNRAVTYLETSDLDLAEADLERVFKLDPNCKEAFAVRGLLKLMKKQPNEAEIDLVKSRQFEQQTLTLVADLKKRYLEPVKPKPSKQGKPYRANSPDAAIAWLSDALKNNDDPKIAQALASPVGPWLCGLYQETQKFVTAMEAYNNAREFRAGNFQPKFDRPIWPGMNPKGGKLPDLKLTKIDILSRKPSDGNPHRIILDLRMRFRSPQGKEVIKRDNWIAELERGQWRLLTPTLTGLGADAVIQLKEQVAFERRRLSILREEVQLAADATQQQSDTQFRIDATMFKAIKAYSAEGPMFNQRNALVDSADDIATMVVAKKIGWDAWSMMRGVETMRHMRDHKPSR